MEKSTKHKKFILVAEDDASYARVYRMKLAAEGYEVAVASNGQEALDICKEKKPDLILMDLIMPIKDGFETLQELRTMPGCKNVKVIVLSNLGQEDDIARARSLGAVAYYIKSDLTVKEMIAKVEEHVG